MDKEINCDGTHEVVCPYCGQEHGDSWELSGYDGEESTIDCGTCGEEFIYVRNVSVDYTTCKREEKSNAD